jgi:hypothetical protein
MQKSLTRLLDALKRYHPEKVILFGSAAREDADAESGLIGGVCNPPMRERLRSVQHGELLAHRV